MIEKFGELFEKSFKEFRENFETYLVIMIVLSLMPSLFMYFFSFHFNEYMSILDKNAPFSEVNNHMLNYPYLFPFVILLIISSLIGCFLMTSLLYKTMNIGQKKNPKLQDSLSGGAKYFFKYLGLMMLLFLIIMILFIPVIILFLLVYLESYPMMIIYVIFLMILYALLFIPFIMFAIYWIFSAYILIGENKGIIESLKSSKKIVENHWLETLGYVLLFTLVGIVIALPFVLLTNGLDYFIESLFIFGFVQLIINFLNNLITLPLSLLFFKNLYFSMKKGTDNKIDSKKRKKKK